MEKEKYILNPTKAAASAYWKIEKFKIPSNMMILNENEFHTDFLQKYEDDIYFKLLHDLKNIDGYTLPSYKFINRRKCQFSRIDEFPPFRNASEKRHTIHDVCRRAKS